MTQISHSSELVQYTEEQYKLIKSVLSVDDKTPDDVVKTAIGYCQAAKLDPMKKPVAIIAYGDKYEIVFTIQAITTIASRAGWAGQDPIEYGPTVQAGSAKVPQWAQQTVYKMVNGVRCPFTGPRVYFAERSTGKSSWAKQPIAMINKCATAAALRLAFPEELAHAYAEEESIYTPQEAVDNSGVDAIKAKLKGQSDELKTSIESVNACATSEELKELAITLKEHSSLTQAEKQELWVVYQEKEKELSE